MKYPFLKKVIVLVSFFVFLLGVATFGQSAFAAPPGSTYAPSETLTPTCNPGTANCTVRAAAAAGTNADITSLSALTTALSVAQGGTGTTTFSVNGILFGNGTSFIQNTLAGTAYQILRVPLGGGAPSFGSIDLTQSAAVSGALSLLNGGTGTTTASGVRTTIGAAALGANSDITSLSALSTALSPTQGGTGLNSFSAGDLLYASGVNTLARLPAGANGLVLTMASGVPSWVASTTGGVYTAGNGLSLATNQFTVNESQLNLNNITGPLLVSKGGTGAVSTSTARTNLLAAASGANSDITSLAGLSTPLSPAQGGTGTSTVFTQGSLVFAGTSGNFGQNNAGLFWDNANSRLGIGSTSPASKLEVNGTIAGIHLKGVGATPGIAAGAGAGTSPTISVRGTDIAGEITLTTGTLPSLSATVLTLTFASSYNTSPFISLVPANALTALLSGATMVFPTVGASTISLTSGATALTAATTYKWHYMVIE